VELEFNTHFDWNKLYGADAAIQFVPDLLIDRLASRLAIQLRPEEKAILMRYLTTVSYGSKTLPNGEVIPDTSKLQPINWAGLKSTERAQMAKLKISGLMELMFGMRGNNIK